jgi:hypothetical protein
LQIRDDDDASCSRDGFLRAREGRAVARRAESGTERVDRRGDRAARRNGFDDQRRTIVEAEKADERAGRRLLDGGSRERPCAIETARRAHAERRVHGDDRHGGTRPGLRPEIRPGERQREEQHRGDPGRE